MRTSSTVSQNRGLIIGASATILFLVLNVIGIEPFQAGWVEMTGVLTGAWAVWLLAKNSMFNWPFAIVNGLFFVVLFFTAKLYADMAINMWYVAAALWGWYYWKKGGANKQERPISRISKKEVLILLLVLALGTLGVRELLLFFNGAAPFLDAITATMSMIAFYMQGRRYIENWGVWILADVIYIPLYFSRDLVLTGMLYIVFMAMCFYGIYNWRREMHRQKAESLESTQPKIEGASS